MTTLLAIETATEACSVALLHGDALVARHEIAPRRHAELVLGMIDAVLAEAGVARGAIDAVAVGRGPGAFTGVRLAISLAQGLALGLDRPVVPVSTLAALALVAWREAGADGDGMAVAVLAAIDARMGEVYAAAYDVGDDGLPQSRGEETLSLPAQLRVEAAPRWIVGGSGLVPYGDALRAVLAPAALREFPDALPDALAIAQLAAAAFARGEAIDAALAQPVYLRDRVAQTTAERLADKANSPNR